jgi:hypothetical protein
MSRAAVSVIIPTHNYARFLGATIASVLAQQPVRPEIIVVDDASTDDTQAVIARFRDVRYYYQSHSGVAAARNRGAAEAGGDVLWFLDADDQLTPGAVDALSAFLDRHPAVDAVVGTWTYMDASGAPLPQSGRIPPGPLTARQIVLDVGQPATPGAALIRRVTFEGLGGFDASVSPAEDLDLWIRLAAAGGRIVGVDHPTIRIRVHGHNASGQADVMARQSGTVYDRFADTQPDGREVRRRARFYAGLALAAACWQDGNQERWRAVLMDPSVEGSPAWESPETFVRLAYLVLPHGSRARSVLRARWREVAAALADALTVLERGPAQDRRRIAAGLVALAEVQWSADQVACARSTLSRALRTYPRAIRFPGVPSMVLKSLLPRVVIDRVRSLRRSASLR